jgi:hypothetical protein
MLICAGSGRAVCEDINRPYAYENTNEGWKSRSGPSLAELGDFLNFCVPRGR